MNFSEDSTINLNFIEIRRVTPANKMYCYAKFGNALTVDYTI